MALFNKSKRSNIWFHFTEDTDKSVARVKCNHCSTFLSIKSGSLGNLNRHMKAKHPTISMCVQRQAIYELPRVTMQSESAVSVYPVLPSTSSSSLSYLDVALIPSTSSSNSENVENLYPFTVPFTNYMHKLPSSLKMEQIDKQVVKMVAKGLHDLCLVEEPEFKKLIQMVSNYPGYRLPTKKTLSTTLIPKHYINVLESIKEKITEAQAVCLCIDGWTSVINNSYISVTAHFVDSEGALFTALLGCINFNEQHTSNNLSCFLKQMINDWQVTNKVACIVSDNAANIRSAIELGGWGSIICFAHTLNLVLQSAIREISVIINKVKTVVEYFKKNTAALDKLHEMQKQMRLPLVKLKQECATRWNSCYDMLERIFQIKDAIITTLALLRNDLCIQQHEWIIIEKMITILRPFNEITTELSSEKYVSLSKVLIIAQLLTKHITKCLSEPHEQEVKAVVEVLDKELHERFYDLEHHQLYAESALLDPRFRRRGFQTPEAFDKARDNLLRNLCNLHTNTSTTVHNTVVDDAIASTSHGTNEKSVWDEFDSEMFVIRQFQKYMNEANIYRKEDPLQWWYSRKHIYPLLYQYMLKRLCIQATSVSCERFFSNAADQVLLNQRRTFLQPDEVSQLLFLHDNM